MGKGNKMSKKLAMNLKGYLQIGDKQLERFKDIYRRYRMMYEDPDNCLPMFIIEVPVENLPTWEERLADPIVMLKAEMDILRPHLELEDDCVPTVRVEFGAAQVAVAFGCEMHILPNNLPGVKRPVLKEAKDVYKMEKPSLDAGWYGKLKEYTRVFLENLPEGIHIQHPDIQSPFNSAHLIRGNDIFIDFYDEPGALDALLDLITDYMIDLVPHLKSMISTDREWFFDWGAMWKGTARISNCSTHMISPDQYKHHVMPRDMRLLKTIGGGRMHYCGTSGEVINEFFKVPYITGLDYDADHHDLFSLSERAPKHVTLLHSYWGTNSDETIQRLLKGDWPKKRDIIVQVHVFSLEEGDQVLKNLHKSVNK